MADELKPCPFCGGPARTFVHNGATQASCAGGHFSCAGSDVTAPLAMWNRRADAEMAVAEAIRRAVEAVIAGDTVGMLQRRIRALAPADALAEVQRLREELDEAQGLIYAARLERNAAEDQEKELAEELRAVRAERDAALARVENAKAAQAMVVERADIDAALDAMEANMRADGQTPLDWREDLPPEDQDKLRACVRAGIAAALADKNGLALVQALRAERDAFKAGLAAANEIALNAIAEADDLRARLVASEKAEAERDRLAAANAALEAKVARLVGAAEYILDSMGINAPDYQIDPDDDFLDAANSNWVRDVLTRIAAALAEVQARDEGAILRADKARGE